MTFKTTKEAEDYFIENIYTGIKDNWEYAFERWIDNDEIIVEELQ